MQRDAGTWELIVSFAGFVERTFGNSFRSYSAKSAGRVVIASGTTARRVVFPISSPKMKYDSATPILNFVNSSVLAAVSGRTSESSLSTNSIN